MEVFEGIDVIIFINFLRGKLAAHDAAERAMGISHSWHTAGQFVLTNSPVE
jgi:hypothetical protein